jgi:putative heme transporter
MALVIGGQLWGIAGMILFIPLLGIAKVVFDHVDE